MTFRLPATCAVALLALASWPAGAQTAPAKPASAPPAAWSIAADAARGAVQIGATAKGGSARLVLGCGRASGPGEQDLTASLSGYRGAALRTDGQVEPAMLFASGEDWRDAFSIRLRYSAARQGWELAHPLSPIFLRSFSRGATLSMVNAANQEVLTFDLTGSTAATRAMREGCGLPS